MAYQHIIWDWNGTLFDDAWLCVEVMNGMLTARGLTGLTPTRYETVFDFPVIDYYGRLGFDFVVEPFELLSNEFMRGYRSRMHECALRPGAREILEQARARGITHSILSAMQQNTLDSLIDHFGLRTYFRDVVGISNHHAAGKLDSARRWMAGQRIAPESMLFVGDTTHDHAVAEALGVAMVYVHSGHHSRARLAATGGRVIESLAEVLA